MMEAESLLDNPERSWSGRRNGAGQGTYSLSLLFQLVTGCGIFFSVFQWFPLLAVLVTAVVTPALVRTAVCAQVWQAAGGLPWWLRINCFLSGIVLVLAAATAGMIAVLGISIGFGLAAVLFEIAVDGHPFGTFDVALLGASGGLIFGLGAGLIVVAQVMSSGWLMGMPLPLPQTGEE
jgi:hypothetical protein